ncbi:hypothetical protein F5Y18DRAFT_56928 [Xylariaceae sp. FL1019]|nr:hypothetical protein F5Y18DRAFT_56928 [Xylariaceae sp. FL1019]
MSSSHLEQAANEPANPIPTENAQDDLTTKIETQDEAVKDQVDGAVATGPKRADQTTGGRVQVAETGDLHDLAARRQSQSKT